MNLLLDENSMPNQIDRLIRQGFGLKKEEVDPKLPDMIWKTLMDAIVRERPDIEFDGFYEPTNLSGIGPDQLSGSIGLGQDHVYILRHASKKFIGMEHQYCYPAAFIFVTLSDEKDADIEATVFDEGLVVPTRTECHGFYLTDTPERKIEYTGNDIFLQILDSMDDAVKAGKPFLIFKAMIGSAVVTIEKKRFFGLYTERRHRIIDQTGFISCAYSLPENKAIADDAKKQDDDAVEEVTSVTIDDEDDDEESPMTVMVSSNTGKFPPPEVIDQLPLPPTLKQRLHDAWKKIGIDVDKLPKKKLPDLEDKRTKFLAHIDFARMILSRIHVKPEYLKESVENIRSYLHMEQVFNNLTGFQILLGGDMNWNIGYMTEMYDSPNDTFTRYCSQYSFRKEGKPVHMKIPKANDMLDRNQQLIGFMAQKKETFASLVFLECKRNPKDWFDCEYKINWCIFDSHLPDAGIPGGELKLKKLEVRNNDHFYI